MAKFIKGLAEGWSSRGNKYGTSIHRFPDLKVDKISSSLKLEKRGKEDGKSGVPDEKSNTMTAAELEAVDEVRKLRANALNNFEMEIESYASRIASVKSDRQHISLMEGEARHKIFTQAKGWENKLENQRVRVAEHQQKLRRFQEQNSVEGPPRETGNIFMAVGLLLFFALFETGMNAYFFAESNPMGYLGSIMLASVISFVNISVSGILGFFSRAININRTLAKMRGYFLIVLFVAVATAINLAVAHLRDALESNPWDVSLILAISTLMEGPLDLKSFSSWLVCIFGGVVSFTAFWKGHSFFDPYPGYGNLWKENEDSIDDYASLYDKAQEDLNDLFEDSSKVLKGEVDRRRVNLKSAEDAIVARETLVRNLSVFIETCNSSANRLLRIYRDANLKNRENPAPGYFDNEFSFDDYKMPDISQSSLRDPERDEKEVEQVEEEAKLGVEKLLAEREKAILTFPTVRKIKEDASKAVVSSTHDDNDSFKKAYEVKRN